MADIDIVILAGLLGLLLGVLLRTFAPFAQKLYEGGITWDDFLNRFLALAAAAFVAGTSFYLGLAPLTDNILYEFLLAFFLGVAGNEILNRLYHVGEIFYSKRQESKI